MVEDEEFAINPPVRVKRPEPDRVLRVERLSTIKAEVEARVETER